MDSAADGVAAEAGRIQVEAQWSSAALPLFVEAQHRQNRAEESRLKACHDNGI